MIPPHASAGSAERYPSAYGLSAAVCQALRAAFIPRRMRCLWAAGLAAALALTAGSTARCLRTAAA